MSCKINAYDNPSYIVGILIIKWYDNIQRALWFIFLWTPQFLTYDNDLLHNYVKDHIDLSDLIIQKVI